MLNIFTVHPYLISLIGAVCQTLRFLARIWLPSEDEAQQIEKRNPFILNVLNQFVNGIGQGLLFLFGVIMFDSALSWILGQWVYTDWRYQLPSVVLGLILGLQFVFDTLLKKPEKLELIFASVLIAGQIYFIHFYSAILENLKDQFTLALVYLSVLAVCYAIFSTVQYIIRNISKTEQKKQKSKNQNQQNDSDISRKTPKYLWNIEEKYNKIFTLKWDIILLIIITIEAMLKLYGTSLFIW
ncbi:MAG: hypothetical protein GF364_06915 [Candidatus Lokiarchaeota archaeon]|nr:hypothetical protein [Candidatus Lokiarchaeota archaeon]